MGFSLKPMGSIVFLSLRHRMPASCGGSEVMKCWKLCNGVVSAGDISHSLQGRSISWAAKWLFKAMCSFHRHSVLMCKCVKQDAMQNCNTQVKKKKSLWPFNDLGRNDWSLFLTSFACCHWLSTNLDWWLDSDSPVRLGKLLILKPRD